ncbi:uncharacterized protein LOC115225747 [Octopus sinensis]|uniref:Uncharacterized protein LOC115225747 n=1 Tax=Octopus sinensis TaxID=2607531 RepID=A0A6P7TLX1_9MOLL|nr:uncharacterized protein LOC115225747 [Octopus sinensis]
MIQCKIWLLLLTLFSSELLNLLRGFGGFYIISLFSVQSCKNLAKDGEGDSSDKHGCIRLPSFTGDAGLWLAQVESHFAAHAVPPQQQLHLLYSSLPSRLATSVRDLIMSPHPDATYASVKAEILRRNTRSEESQFNELMADEQLGDRTPSQFLRHLREPSGNAADAPLLQRIFFSRLPADMQTMLATVLVSVSVDQIATMADKILEFPKPSPSRGLCACTEPPPTVSPTQNSLAEWLDTLTWRIDDLCRAIGRRPRSCSRSGSAEKAEWCTQLCTFQPSGS